jgi:hypothetical protein
MSPVGLLSPNVTMDRDRSVTVLGMPDNEIDPAGNTQQFRAFVHRGGGEPATKSGGNTGLMIGVVVAVVIVAVVIGLAIAMM